MLKPLQRKPKASTTGLLGLAAGAIGVAELAHASKSDNDPMVMLQPGHYHLMDDGVVIFQLQTGEQLRLKPDQYLILQDRLLLITDELAQTSIESLPVRGSIRAQLPSGLQPVRSPDGSVVKASDSGPLWSGDGPAPRLFEDVDIGRYELAQNIEDPDNQVSIPNTPLAGNDLFGGLLAAIAISSSSTKEAPGESNPIETPTIPYVLYQFDDNTPIVGSSNTKIYVKSDGNKLWAISGVNSTPELIYSSFDASTYPNSVVEIGSDLYIGSADGLYKLSGGTLSKVADTLTGSDDESSELLAVGDIVYYSSKDPGGVNRLHYYNTDSDTGGISTGATSFSDPRDLSFYSFTYLGSDGPAVIFSGNDGGVQLAFYFTSSGTAQISNDGIEWQFGSDSFFYTIDGAQLESYNEYGGAAQFAPINTPGSSDLLVTADRAYVVADSQAYTGTKNLFVYDIAAGTYEEILEAHPADGVGNADFGQIWELNSDLYYTASPDNGANYYLYGLDVA